MHVDIFAVHATQVKHWQALSDAGRCIIMKNRTCSRTTTTTPSPAAATGGGGCREVRQTTGSTADSLVFPLSLFLLPGSR